MMTDGVILPRWLILLLPPSLVLLAIGLWSTPQWLAPAFYATMGLIGWVFMGQGRWRRVQAWLQRLPGPVWLRCVLLGYAAVVAEEMLVGTSYALAEGNWPAVWLPRMGQFIAFNLFAFTGAIIGLALAYGRFPGLRPWHWVLAGAWGLYAERTWLLAWDNPIAGALLLAPNLTVYSIILAPLMLSLPAQSGVTRAPVWALLPVWAVMFALSIPAVGAVLALRAAFPGAFPGCDYIPCP